MDTKSEMKPSEVKLLMKKMYTRIAVVLLSMTLLVLLSAGTFDFWQFYVYLTIIILPMLYITIYFLNKDPRFLERRIKMKETEKPQKIVFIISAIATLAEYIIPGLDHRFGWSSIPFGVVIVADIVIIFSYLLIIRTFKENSFASRTVEISKGQKVISTGLYGIIRHPMYLGVMIMTIAVPFALDSYWTIIPCFALLLSLVLRTVNEEKFLEENLLGYKEYCEKVKYRIIPYVW